MNLRMKTGAEGHPTVPNLIAILLTNGPTGFRIVLRICSGTSPFSRGFQQLLGVVTSGNALVIWTSELEATC